MNECDCLTVYLLLKIVLQETDYKAEIVHFPTVNPTSCSTSLTMNLIKIPCGVLIQVTSSTLPSFAMWYDLFATYYCSVCPFPLFLMLTINLRAEYRKSGPLKLANIKLTQLQNQRARTLPIKNVNLILKPGERVEWREFAAEVGIGNRRRAGISYNYNAESRRLLRRGNISHKMPNALVLCVSVCVCMCVRVWGCGRKANDCSQSYKLTTM